MIEEQEAELRRELEKNERTMNLRRKKPTPVIVAKKETGASEKKGRATGVDSKAFVWDSSDLYSTSSVYVTLDFPN